MNARDELLKEVGNKIIYCAAIIYVDYETGSTLCCDLPLNYSSGDMTNFLSSLNFDYDSYCDGEDLTGTIWYENGTWSERVDNHGSGWWEHRKCPEIPKELLGEE